MSKIKVNIVKDRKGNTLTLGSCGTTVQLGTNSEAPFLQEISWQTTAKTSDFTAQAGEGYFLDTTSNPVAVTLPASPSIGDQVAITDYAGTFDTNAGVLDPNGKKIQGNTEGVGITAALKSIVLVYTSEAQGWLISKTGDSTPLVNPTITFDTAAGSLGTLLDTQRSDPNGNLSPVTATSTFGTLTYSVQSGSLPAGLTLNSSTGAFVGTADAVLTQTVSTFTIRATIDVSNYLDREFSITVKSAEIFITATGGTVSTVGDYKVHVFTGPGTFCVSCAGDDPGSNSVEYVVVAGGGSGGGDRGGGGGAGGLRHNFPSPSVAGFPVTATAYPITVGSGGNGVGDNTRGNSGSNSVFSTITSAGGGGGGTISGTESGISGGSGGGAARTSGVGSGNTPPVSPPQGNPGSNNPAPLQPDNRAGGGGGGGHTSAASNGGPTNGGTGGAGTQFPCAMVPDSYGSPARFFAGGGGGGRDTRSPGTPGPGGNGGGTPGAPSPGQGPSSPANSGGGSGGGSVDGSGSGNGGSGIVIIRYKFQ